MPVRKAIAEKGGTYFITFTCSNWLPLFKICNAYDAVYNWLVELPEQYEHSSSKYYYTGNQGTYPVTSFMELRDIDLTALHT